MPPPKLLGLYADICVLTLPKLWLGNDICVAVGAIVAELPKTIAGDDTVDEPKGLALNGATMVCVVAAPIIKGALLENEEVVPNPEEAEEAVAPRPAPTAGAPKGIG